ncbi:DUF2064 domain-containing protein [Rubrobacter tropicus]|uniref:DUF2064 domain-containing protein n=1 Tax=Rubrobacter tropicus TaxID=2653851 RepID=A0A6G8Q8B9_9ACTN|nr:TIGR04282 family arsenosugar biosynthesis glycosyltransferase [Rubrobacter tropicus]QIN82682.1 DUF2064 domain-containing protein [Rubrobacter tropicus]
MAKAPIPGAVKTRLRLPPEDAARLQTAFVTDAVDKARGLAPTTVAGAPGDRLSLIRPLLSENNPLIPQCDGDLGDRMLAAAHALFADVPDPVVILGTDTPTLPPEAIAEAASSLDKYDISIIPSTDGGYVLLGLRGPYGRVFSGIEWSTPEVYGQTLTRAKEAGLSVYEGAPGRDVDEPADLARVREELKARPWLAPRTAEALRLL